MLKQVKRKAISMRKLLMPSNYRKLRLYYAKNYESMPIDEEMVLYETRDGKSIVDSPYSIFLSLAQNPKYSKLKHVWVISEKNQKIEENIPEELINKVTFVYRGTLEYMQAMLEAKYLISNSTFESFFVKRPGQIYINTWHGTPIKKMGFDVQGSLSNSKNVLRNFLMTDYLLSPNEHTSNIFMHSYKLVDIYPGEILEGGYPRIDSTFYMTKDSVIKMLNKHGVIVNNDKPIILFSPTWKGNNGANVSDDVEQLVAEVQTLKARLSEQYQVLIKVHPFAYNKVVNDSRLEGILVPDFLSANDVLAATDILITDYSSIFFDFLVTGKPIVFYAWDKDLYTNSRGLYLELKDLPGPTAETIDELVDCIKDIENQQQRYQNQYEALAMKMVKYDDGQVTQRYIDYIFEGKKSSNMVIRKVDSTKKKILIYPGGVLSNGITSSFTNLLNNINYDEYDVSVLLNEDRREEIRNNLKRLPANVRPLFRFGGDILTFNEKLADKDISNNGLNKKNEFKYPEVGYRREMNRLTANLKFDVAIDFSGYSYFWGRHILGANADKKVVFVHNNIKADSMREVNGKFPMLQGLNSLFSIYKKFDKILNVSPMTRDLNFKNLGEYVTKEQMSVVYNTINISEILGTGISEIAIEEPVIEINRRLLEVEEPVEVRLYKNLSAISLEEFKSIHLENTSHIVQHAAVTIDAKNYIKVSIDFVYMGWINDTALIPKSVEIYEIEDYHAFGTVSRAYHHRILKNIEQSGKNEEIVSYIKPFKNRYLEIMKMAQTSHGKFFYVKYLNEELGWVRDIPVMRIHEVSSHSLENLYFKNRMIKQDRLDPVIHTSKVVFVEEYVTFLNKKEVVDMWTDPEGTAGAQMIAVSEDYLNETFRVTEYAYVGNEVYAKLRLLQGEVIGYTNQKNLIKLESEPVIKELEVEESEFGFPEFDLTKSPIPKFNGKLLNFVHMGRLSPEKNQEVLIRAFAKFQKDFPNTRLYILGKGPLQAQLVQVVQELELEGIVILLGHIQRPHYFISQADCLVLPSLYEGQPMVLLEALTLGLKVLASDIPANINVLHEDERYGFMTSGTTIDAVYDGFIRLSQFEGEFQTFDYEEYNQLAIQSFYTEIE